MDSEFFPSDDMENSNIENIHNTSRLSMSSGSSKTGATHGTSEDGSLGFDNTVDSTATPQGSYDTSATSVLGFSHKKESINTSSKDSLAEAVGPPHDNHDNTRLNSQGPLGQRLSQLLTTQAAQPIQSVFIGPETPAHLRWETSDSLLYQKDALLSPTNPPITTPLACISGGQQMFSFGDSEERGNSNSTSPKNATQFVQQPPIGTRPTQLVRPTAGSFSMAEMQKALASTADSTRKMRDPTEDLGIDVLRLSPKVYPIRQPAPAPSSASMLPNDHIHRFMPMQAVMQQTLRGLFPNELDDGTANSTKFSARYHGMHTETNASAEHLATEQNCALWLTNLPPSLTTHHLLSAIRNVGRIWCSYINYPDYVTHQTAAAKVVFFSPEPAQQLLSMSWTQGLYIQGYRVKISHNRIKYASHPIVGRVSRILIITGRADFVNEESLSKFFKQRFIFQVDEVVELIKAGGRVVLEFKFGSYRCQAQMGKMALEKDRPDGFEKVEFGDDPCEVGDTLSSYGIAAERIQGRGL